MKLCKFENPIWQRPVDDGMLHPRASVTMMKKPDSHDPRNTRKPAHQCPHIESRRSPNRNRPKKADSAENEKTPSIARGWPMTLPVAREN